MMRTFKPRIRYIRNNNSLSDYTIPEMIKESFDFREVRSFNNNEYSSDILDSEIVISDSELFQARPYQLGITISDSNELDSDLIWITIHKFWFGFENIDETNKNQNVELKKGISELINSGHVSSAGKMLDVLVDEFPEDGDWYSYLAMVRYLENDTEAAIYLLRQLFISGQRSEDVLYNLGFMYKVDGEILNAIYYLEWLMKITENNAIITEAKELLDECYYYVT